MGLNFIQLTIFVLLELNHLTHIVCSFPSLIEKAFLLRVVIGLSARFLKVKQTFKNIANILRFASLCDRSKRERGGGGDKLAPRKGKRTLSPLSSPFPLGALRRLKVRPNKPFHFNVFFLS